MTLVEYVLFAGCFVLVAISAVGGLNSTARAYFQQSSSKIGQPINRVQYDANGQRQQQASTTSITAPPSTTTIPPTTTTTRAPTTTIPPTTTTTRAPTTTIPPTTTTTTRATTTTTAPPTTTTTAAPLRVVHGTIGEGGSLTLTAPGASTVKFTSVVFASYGTPTSSSPYSTGWCHASTSSSVVATAAVGRHSVTISATNGVFGDPCVGTGKRLSVTLSY